MEKLHEQVPHVNLVRLHYDQILINPDSDKRLEHKRAASWQFVNLERNNYDQFEKMAINDRSRGAGD